MDSIKSDLSTITIPNANYDHHHHHRVFLTKWISLNLFCQHSLFLMLIIIIIIIIESCWRNGILKICFVNIHYSKCSSSSSSPSSLVNEMDSFKSVLSTITIPNAHHRHQHYRVLLTQWIPLNLFCPQSLFPNAHHHHHHHHHNHHRVLLTEWIPLNLFYQQSLFLMLIIIILKSCQRNGFL